MPTALQQIEAASNRGKKIVEVMCNASSELTDRLHLLRLDKGGLCLRKGILLLQPFCDILRHFRKTDELAVLVSDGLNDNSDPELAAVFSYPPSFIDVFAFAGSSFESLLVGSSRCPRLIKI